MFCKSRIAPLCVSLFFLLLGNVIAQPLLTNDPVIEESTLTPLTAAECLAQAEQRNDKQSYLLMAAERFVADHQWPQASAILAQTIHLTVEQQDEKNLLLAYIKLSEDEPEKALQRLLEIKNARALSTRFLILYHEALAQAYRSTNKISQSLAERIGLESLPLSESEQIANRRELWLTLVSSTRHELSALLSEAAEGSELQGWAELAAAAAQFRSNPKALIAALDVWQTKFNVHPANEFLPNPLDSIVDKMLMPPERIALLVPLSGPFSGPGNAIHDGFMSSFTADKSKKNDAQILVYDTGKAEVTQLYEQALHDGAQYIVGPLVKNEVAALASRFHPVPTLFLNDTSQILENAYSFGLSPAHEARQVAIKAMSKGHKRALVFAPNNAWGDELVKEFKAQWEHDGGRVADVFSYNVNPQVKEDFNQKLRDFLRITDSQQRERKIRELLGQEILAVPSRRQDFDMIFLLAYPSKARQIMPALKYYYADDVPVYATSAVYSGHADVTKDKDLNGIIFCDIPWVFTHEMTTKNWPEQFNSYNRLYALGIDSYSLATQLNQLMLFPAHGTKKTQEVLYLKPNKEVARVLSWAQFDKEGLIHVVNKTA